MPGLFDPQGGGDSGILGGFQNYIDNVRSRMAGPAGQEMQFRNKAYQELQQGGDPNAALLMANPAAYQMNIGQRNLMATIQALQGMKGPNGQPFTPQQATFLALHPDELSKMTAPQKVGPGEQLQAPLDILGMSGGGGPAAGIQGQPSQMPQPGQPQGQAGGGYAGPTNTSGQMDAPAIQQLVDRRIKGDAKVTAELGGSMGSGIGAINRKNFQEALTKTLGAQGLTAADLVQRDAKFPAYEDATKTNAQTAARMQLAQSEAFGMLPLLTKAAASTNPSNYPIWNKGKLEVLAQTGDPRSAELASYANALINTYARGISTRPQGATDSDKEHLREVVNPYWSRGQWEAGARAIMNELGVAHSAIGKNQNRIDVQFGFGKNADPNDVAGAKAAIGRGADKEDVVRRFEEGGFNAPKF